MISIIERIRCDNSYDIEKYNIIRQIIKYFNYKDALYKTDRTGHQQAGIFENILILLNIFDNPIVGRNTAILASYDEGLEIMPKEDYYFEYDYTIKKKVSESDVYIKLPKEIPTIEQLKQFKIDIIDNSRKKKKKYKK